MALELAQSGRGETFSWQKLRWPLTRTDALLAIAASSTVLLYRLQGITIYRLVSDESGKSRLNSQLNISNHSRRLSPLVDF